MPLARLAGIARSLALYYGRPGQLRRMQALYGAFIRPGDLCFDIGAHVGNRTLVFRRLGARVVALEPQPDFARLLRWGFRGDPAVVLLEEAIAREPGRVTLQISRRHPTVTTASTGFVDQVSGATSFAGVRWDERHGVPAVTLDQLIAAHGPPAFVKIDVEGFEEEALAGLSQPVPAISFEYLAETLPQALRCIDRLEQLAPYHYNASAGESMAFALPAWVDGGGIRRFIESRPPGSGSGDVYARRRLDAP